MFQSELVQLSTMTEYDLGGEGDMFKAPEPIIEERIVGLDPLSAAISMVSFTGDSVLAQDLKFADITTLENEPLLSEVFYECHKDLVETAAIGTSFAEALEMEIPPMKIDVGESMMNELPLDSPFQKSASKGCLSSVEWMWIQGAALKSNLLECSGLDFGAAETLSSGNGDTSHTRSALGQLLLLHNCKTEGRREKLLRYINKKTKRNFGRKIKYACRKALADSQPRVRGRFAKTEDFNVSVKK
ncbi:hypothetical protein SAY87_027178 [Trapa incisa]|uniref:CCT domain-containing protein n=1 Tax=Trapa incisa TaxID=236973 RepID=A0AAN7H250_9MYRT|nr:hypothetical protein SAY87_027178 [Trapa incisa]